MSYKYKEIPKDKEVVWITLFRPYEGLHSQYFPKDLRIGDKTWVCKMDYDQYFPTILFEDNRYCGNFEQVYFELVTDNIYSEPTYEIY